MTPSGAVTRVCRDWISQLSIFLRSKGQTTHGMTTGCVVRLKILQRSNFEKASWTVQISAGLTSIIIFMQKNKIIIIIQDCNHQSFERKYCNLHEEETYQWQSVHFPCSWGCWFECDQLVTDLSSRLWPVGWVFFFFWKNEVRFSKLTRKPSSGHQMVRDKKRTRNLTLWLKGLRSHGIKKKNNYMMQCFDTCSACCELMLLGIFPLRNFIRCSYISTLKTNQLILCQKHIEKREREIWLHYRLDFAMLSSMRWFQ